jgi:hypothetical protein
MIPFAPAIAARRASRGIIMRKSVVAVWLALSSVVAAVPAAADSPISLPPLAPGEVLLEVGAIGVATSPATSATLTVTIMVEGETEEQARRLADAALARVVAAARAAGVAAADIDSSAADASTMSTDLYNATYAMGDNGLGATSMSYANAGAVIQMRNPAALPALRRTLSGIEHVSVGEPDYRLDDDSAARRTARSDALRRARADADAYAASMNMRVVRVLRVTERGGTDFMSMLFGEPQVVREFEPGRTNRNGQVQTLAVLGVDYALAPR